MKFKLYNKSAGHVIDKPSETVLIVEKDSASFEEDRIKRLNKFVAEDGRILHDSNAKTIAKKIAKLGEAGKKPKSTDNITAFCERTSPHYFENSEEGKELSNPYEEGFRNNIASLTYNGEGAIHDRAKFIKSMRDVFHWIRRQRNKTLDIIIDDVEGKFARAFIYFFIREFRNDVYEFTALKSKQNDDIEISDIYFYVNVDDEKDVTRTFQRAIVLADSMDFAKDLGNMPANLMTPKQLANAAQKAVESIVERIKQEDRDEKAGAEISVEIMGKEEIEKLGMDSFLSVAKGSEERPRLIKLDYAGPGENKKKICLVGKGITFDAGGISLKPAAGMDEMKYDMMGAASVIATFLAVCRMKLPVDLVVIVPTCENMPSGVANKPGDVVKSMSGKTIEILNTDAEGRLILCDALTYANKFKPDMVVDVATLTGACVVALGEVTSGLFSNDSKLTRRLAKAGRRVDDKCWPLPIYPEYEDQLKSNFADLANVGGRPAGSITAAAFLSNFVGDWAWAHLDVAGTAWKSGAKKGATGRPVPLLVEFMIAASENTDGLDGEKDEEGAFDFL